MNHHFLIDAVMRQTTVLIAQLATTGGVRAPLAHLANQVFLELTRALEEQGVSRRVGADMFGMALRAYVRKIQRLSESTTDRGRSLWEAVFAFISETRMVTRQEVLARFVEDEDKLVRGVLHDLTETGLVFCSGAGSSAVYRAATADELQYMRQRRPGAGADELLWVVIYREGPVTREQLLSRAGIETEEADACLQRLLDAGRIRRNDVGAFVAGGFFVAHGAEAGWEAAVLDHYHAVVRTICCRLNPDPQLELPASAVGGSTYTIEVWPGHPLRDEVLSTLDRFRQAQSELRLRVDEHNKRCTPPDSLLKVVMYAGQSVTQHQGDGHD